MRRSIFTEEHEDFRRTMRSFIESEVVPHYQEWYDATPDDFIFAVKCPRYITHMRKLTNIDEPLANFYASGVLALAVALMVFAVTLWRDVLARGRAGCQQQRQK